MTFGKNDMIKRQRQFVGDTIDLIENLPRSLTNDIIAKQQIRCSTSVGANYRAAYRGKSTADFINKLKIVEEEADECLYFLDLLRDRKGIDKDVVERLLKEANEILAMTVASIRTAKRNRDST